MEEKFDYNVFTKKIFKQQGHALGWEVEFIDPPAGFPDFGRKAYPTTVHHKVGPGFFFKRFFIKTTAAEEVDI